MTRIKNFIFSHFNRIIVQYNIKVIFMYFLKYFLISYICYRLLITGLYILDSYSLLNIEAPVSSYSSSATKAVSSITESKDINTFLPMSDSSNDFLFNLFAQLYGNLLSIIKPVYLQGNFDELLAQRVFIEFLLFMTIVFTFILFLVFIWNLVLYLNKDKLFQILPKNKIFSFMYSIEVTLIKWTIIIVPIIIFINFFSMIKCYLWLMGNPIPYHELGIDLHQFVADSKVERLLIPFLYLKAKTLTHLRTKYSLLPKWVGREILY